MLRHLEALLASLISAFIKPYRQMTLQMLTKLRVFLKSLLAACDWALERRMIIHDTLRKAD